MPFQDKPSYTSASEITPLRSNLGTPFISTLIALSAASTSEIYNTVTGVERVKDLVERFEYRISESDIQSNLTNLPPNAINTLRDDPNFRVILAGAIEAGAESQDSDGREVLVDLIARRLFITETTQAGRIRRAIGVISGLSGQSLRLIAIVNILRDPSVLQGWIPFDEAMNSRDLRKFDTMFEAVLNSLLPSDPSVDDLETLVELGIAERDPEYAPDGMSVGNNAIRRFLDRQGFLGIEFRDTQFNTFLSVQRAERLLRPQRAIDGRIRDDNQAIARFRLLPIGQLISRSVIGRLLR